MERRLAAIMATDVVGYSRLIRADEEGTLAALKALRADLIDPKIAEHHGRIVKLMGDGMLVEFASVVDAVHAAVETQQAVTDYNADVPADKRIELRIGINLGDVVIDGDDIQGDGINVAGRLEAMAEPGGIYVSGMVYEGVRDRIDIPFEDLGEKTVKNIDRPVRVWRWRAGDGVALAEPLGMSEPLPLPDKPSIAVLPFTNMSGDPEQEYFSDGITEDIITELSRFGSLFVIARNSSFTFKGEAVNVTEVGEKLGVAYVVEGSVRKAGNRVRITAQLVEAATGNHIWAERYDRDLEDIFELQEQVTSSVVGAIAPKLELAEIERAKHKPTSSLDAYDYYLRGMAAFHHWTFEGNEQALDNFYRAIELDPEFANAYGMAARSINQRLVIQPLTVGAKESAEAVRLSRRAADLGRNDAMALSCAGVTLGFAGRDVRGGAALTARALALNPNLSWVWYGDGWLNVWLGKPDIGIERFGRAMELSPHDPMMFQIQTGMAHAYFTAGDDNQAWSWAQRALHDRPDHFPALLAAAASAAYLGRQTEAEDATSRLLKIIPGIGLSYLATFLPYQQQQDAERWSEGLRKAGLPK